MTEAPASAVRPLRWTLDELRGAGFARPIVWASPSVRARAESALGWPVLAPLEPLPSGTDALVVVGGGTLIDEAKGFRAETCADVKLIAAPSLWGSGAEASPVTVRTRGAKKQITIDARWLPDARVVWPELLDSVSSTRARNACGDVWAHALEGFLSPLAKDDLRDELAALLRELSTLPLAVDARWLDVSARACALQAKSSVGLVHGIAHSLEGPLVLAQPHAGWGHAKLCATFLWPVLRFNLGAGDKVIALAAKWGLDLSAIEWVLRTLFERDAYAAALPVLERDFGLVLRDICTRTNCTLVRPSSIEFFRAFEGAAT